MLKGAVARVLGPRDFTRAWSGSVRLRSDKALTSQEVSKIEAVVNNKIAEDAEVLEFSMEREEAEGHFGADIYDLEPAPNAGTLLNIVRISEWDVSNCSMAHVSSTSSIGVMRIDDSPYDESSKEVELKFHLL